MKNYGREENKRTARREPEIIDLDYMEESMSQKQFDVIDYSLGEDHGVYLEDMTCMKDIARHMGGTIESFGYLDLDDEFKVVTATYTKPGRPKLAALIFQENVIHEKLEDDEDAIKTYMLLEFLGSADELNQEYLDSDEIEDFIAEEIKSILDGYDVMVFLSPGEQFLDEYDRGIFMTEEGIEIPIDEVDIIDVIKRKN